MMKMNKINKSNLIDFSNYKYTSYDKDFDNIITYSDIQIVIAINLINYRHANKLTQKDLATLLGVNQSMIAKLERGDYNPTIKFLFEISNKLTGDYTFFIKLMTEISKIAKENDKRNKEIISQVEKDKAHKKSSKNKEKTKNKKIIYRDEKIPQTKVSEDTEKYDS